jgi:hypothetical protein
MKTVYKIKRILLSAVFGFILTNTYGQKYALTFGKEFENIEKKGLYASSETYFDKDENGYYILKTQLSAKRSNYRYYFKHFDNNNNFLKQVEIPSEDSKGNEFLNVRIINGEALAFYRKAKNNGFYLRKAFDGSAGITDVSYRATMMIPDASGKNFSGYAYGTNEKGIDAKYETFSSSFASLSEEDFDLPFVAGKKSEISESMRIADKIIFVAKLKSLSDKSEKFDPVVYIYDLTKKTAFTFESGIKDVEESYSWLLGNDILKVIHKDNRLYLITKLIKKDKFYGIGYTRIDLESMAIEVDKVINFGPNDIAKMISPNTKFKERSNKLQFCEAYVRSDGEVLLMLESQDVSRSERGEIYGAYGNLIVFGISDKGEFDQIKLIEKYQTDWRTGSFISTIINDELFIFMHDLREKYIEGAKMPKNGILYGGEGFFVVCKLSKTDELSFEKIVESTLKLKKTEMTIAPKMAFKVRDNEILLIMDDRDELHQHAFLRITN